MNILPCFGEQLVSVVIMKRDFVNGEIPSSNPACRYFLYLLERNVNSKVCASVLVHDTQLCSWTLSCSLQCKYRHYMCKRKGRW